MTIRTGARARLRSRLFMIAAVAMLVPSLSLPRADAPIMEPRPGTDLRNLLTRLATAVPAIAPDVARIDTTIPPFESSHGWYFLPAYGARHPDTGGPICDPEVLGVLTADLATRRLAPLLMRAQGLAELARRTEQLAPFAEGRFAGASAAPLLEAARARLGDGHAARVRGRVRNAWSRLAMQLRNLTRSRAAPENRVIAAAVELAAVTDVIIGAPARPALVRWANDVSAAYLEAARNQPNARQRCRGHVAPGAPIVE